MYGLFVMCGLFVIMYGLFVMCGLFVIIYGHFEIMIMPGLFVIYLWSS
jgi:hypothetical protein